MGATTFEALGTYVHVSTLHDRDLEVARRRTSAILAEVDRTCSRFRTDSDLTRANAAAGRWLDVDPLLVAAVRVAVEAARLTGGLVHPLLGRPLVSLGYDRDYGALVDRGPVTPVAAPHLDAWRAIAVTAEAIRVPAGTALDLGATGKGFAADLVAATLASELTAPALVSVGGDVAVTGPVPDGWPVRVSERVGGPGVVVRLERGGLATSSTRVRRWGRGGTTYHHLLDPRTGLPARGSWRTASCAGESAVGANTASTAAVVLGAAAPAWLSRNGVSARLVDTQGRVRRTGSWPADGREAA